MATTITSECINCGACEPECPNTAIYAGGVAWELDGESHPALAQDIYYIVPQKCTECVGFYDHEACAAVCPVDCCIPDPNNLESEAVLIERARKLHPEQTFASDFPSRFRKGEAPAAEVSVAGGGDGAAQVIAGDGAAQAIAGDGAAGAAAAVAPAAAPAPKPAVAPAPKPAVVPAAKAPAVPAAAPAKAAAAAPLAMLNLPKDVGAPPGPIGEKHFAGELDEDFDAVLGKVDAGRVKSISASLKFLMRLLAPVLGAMPVAAKERLEQTFGDPKVFSQARATALNVVLNLILYPAILTAFSVLVMGDSLFSLNTRGWITLGLTLGTIETCWRLREGVLFARPVSELVYRGCFWGLPLSLLSRLLARGPGFVRSERKVSFDGFTTDLYGEKIERDRRYGTVYTVVEHSNAYLVRLEMPRKLPASSLKRLWNLPDEMPDYEYSIALEDGVLIIAASVRGEALRRLSYVSPSFPSDFTTRIEFQKPVAGFKHRLRDKVIEVIVLKGEAREELQRAA